MNDLGQFAQQLRQLWSGMSSARRLGTATILIAAVATVLGVGYWASQPDYRVLFSGLSAEDAGAITAKLDSKSVPYRLDAGGATILVPVESLQQMRIALASEDLPAKGGKGFELFDQGTLGATPFTQHVNYVRALQTELARTIMHIDPIIHARVHIVRPDPTPFVRDQKPTTASVVVRLKTGTALPRNVVAGVVALVCRSVEGLARENVSVVDTSGRLLSEEHDAESGGLGTAMDQRRDLEQYLSARAESMLSQVVGPGRALVRVTADLKTQRLKEQKVTYTPDGRVATKETITTSKATGSVTGAKKGPAPGAGSNSEESIQTDYLVSKVIQEFEDKAGTVERLTVAALVDLTPEDKDDKAKAAMSLADVEDIIKKAVGFKTGRDDIKVTQVKLTGIALDSAPDGQWESLQRWQTIATLVRHASLGLTALTALTIVWLLLRRGKTAPEPTAAATTNPAAERLAQAAEQNPEALARVLSQWLDKPERPQRMAA